MMRKMPPASSRARECSRIEILEYVTASRRQLPSFKTIVTGTALIILSSTLVLMAGDEEKARTCVSPAARARRSCFKSWSGTRRTGPRAFGCASRASREGSSFQRSPPSGRTTTQKGLGTGVKALESSSSTASLSDFHKLQTGNEVMLTNLTMTCPHSPQTAAPRVRRQPTVGFTLIELLGSSPSS